MLESLKAVCLLSTSDFFEFKKLCQRGSMASTLEITALFALNGQAIGTIDNVC